MVEEEKEKGAKEVQIVVRAVFIPERVKRMVVSLDRQKVRKYEHTRVDQTIE